MPGTGELTVTGVRARLGRGPECDVVIQGAGVATVHAELSLREGIWWLTDLLGGEGTWVDGERVTGTAAVAPGSVLRLGQAILVFDPRDVWSDSAPPLPAMPVSAPMAVTWPGRDEPMAPSFDWPVRARRPVWLVFLVVAIVIAAVVALLIRVT